MKVNKIPTAMFRFWWLSMTSETMANCKLLQMADCHQLHWIHTCLLIVSIRQKWLSTFNVAGVKSWQSFQRICGVNSVEKTLNGAWHLCRGKIKPKCNRNKYTQGHVFSCFYPTVYPYFLVSSWVSSCF